MFYSGYYQNKFSDIVVDRFEQDHAFMELLARNENAMQMRMQGMLHEVYEGLRRRQ